MSTPLRFSREVLSQFAKLPRSGRTAACLVYMALIDLPPGGGTELGEEYTDRILGQSPWLAGYGARFLQKGLLILEDSGIISRSRQHGRRLIRVTGRSARPGKAAPREPDALEKDEIIAWALGRDPSPGGPP